MSQFQSNFFIVKPVSAISGSSVTDNLRVRNHISGYDVTFHTTRWDEITPAQGVSYLRWPKGRNRSNNNYLQWNLHITYPKSHNSLFNYNFLSRNS